MNKNIQTETNQPLLEVRDIKKQFNAKNKKGKSVLLHALNGVSFSVKKGQTFGLVGESGCGKSTLVRIIMRLTKPTSGDVFFEGINVFSLNKKELKRIRRNIQMVFQDPIASLDPRMTIGDIIREPLIIHGIGDRESQHKTVSTILETVGLQPSYCNRYPHEFSGGQLQRIGIARALILNPKLLLCDEPVSALDVSIQSQILNLLDELQDIFGLTYIFIAHSLNVIKHISDFVGVIYLGKIMEIAPVEDLFKQPLHPYTEALISAIPGACEAENGDKIVLEGEIPSPINPPSGCFFRTRCKYGKEICTNIVPPSTNLGDRIVACHFPLL